MGQLKYARHPQYPYVISFPRKDGTEIFTLYIANKSILKQLQDFVKPNDGHIFLGGWVTAEEAAERMAGLCFVCKCKHDFLPALSKEDQVFLKQTTAKDLVEAYNASDPRLHQANKSGMRYIRMNTRRDGTVVYQVEIHKGDSRGATYFKTHSSPDEAMKDADEHIILRQIRKGKKVEALAGRLNCVLSAYDISALRARVAGEGARTCSCCKCKSP